jgi:hypothetical protein
MNRNIVNFVNGTGQQREPVEFISEVILTDERNRGYGA